MPALTLANAIDQPVSFVYPLETGLEARDIFRN